ncbi:major facilitator superfamily domain-containing protein 10-like [Oppia nitens]|uniref:major facilitator superfamily domain-containing protein 10-like n=1 Tax=Oppia nitens TaxID=1686743 RepID=UPI0023DA1DF4|nr:major facilitator superfamily domain-containing protein 10-like [Oppia nitens]
MMTSMKTKSLVVITTSLILDLLAFTVILPLMPSIVDYYSINDQSGLFEWFNGKVKLSQEWIGSPQEFNKVLFGGLIGSWFSLLQYISQPLVGSLSDIYGRKPLLLICLSGISLSYFCWSLSSQMFTIFLISRTIGGLSKGNISLSTAVVTDVSDESNRGKGMALIGISFSIGFIIGPVLGATFVIWSRSSSPDYFFQLYPAVFALILSLLNIVFIWYYFEESLSLNKRARSLESGLKQAIDYMSPISLFSFRPVNNVTEKDLNVLKSGGRLYFLYLYLYSGLEFTLTFLTHLRFNYSSAEQGRLYLYTGLLMTLIQGSYVRRIKVGNELKTVLTGILMIIPSFLLIGLANNEIQLYIGLTLYAFSSATVVPCLTTIVSSYGPQDQKGVTLGIFRSIGALARALGPISASLVFWRFGATVCYCFGAILLIYPLLSALRLKQYILDINSK